MRRPMMLGGLGRNRKRSGAVPALIFAAECPVGANVNGRTSNTFDSTGSTLIVVVVGYDPTPTMSLSDNQGNTYTGLTEYTGSYKSVQIFYCQNPTTNASHTITVSVASSYSSFTILGFSGISTTDAYEDEAGGASNTPGDVTGTVNNTLLVTGVNHETGSPSFSIDDSFTIQEYTAFAAGQNYGTAIAWKVQPTATTEGPTWTGPGSPEVSAIAAFNPA